MTRAEKKEKAIQKRTNRYAKRMEKYVNKIQKKREIESLIISGAITYWKDSNSPTGYSQKCSYERWGTCQHPCNGDC